MSKKVDVIFKIGQIWTGSIPWRKNYILKPQAALKTKPTSKLEKQRVEKEYIINDLKVWKGWFDLKIDCLSK